MAHLVLDDDSGRHQIRALPVGLYIERGDVVAGRPGHVIDGVPDAPLRARHEVALADPQDVVELLEQLQEENIKAGKIVPPVSLFSDTDLQPVVWRKVL